MRIAVAQFMHETVTFLPDETTRADFIYPGSPLSGAALLRSGPEAYIGGFVKVAQEFDGVELIGLTSPMLPKTSIGSGWITRDAYEWFLENMLRELQAIGTVDGVYLALHGALAVRDVPRPEADIARRIRASVGPHTVIAATFDLHGNEDESFLQWADLAFCVKYYPHYDEYLQGNRAARALIRAIRGDYRPVHVTCKVPILAATVAQWTGAAPWSELVQRALTWEARHPDLYVNTFFGFPWSDVPDAGMTIQATSNDAPDLARRAVDDIAAFAWHVRADLVGAARPCGIAEGVRQAKLLAGEGRRVVLADHSDRSGAATWLLAEVIEQDLSHTVIATLTDPSVAQRLEELGCEPGDSFDMHVGGGRTQAEGPRVRVQGQLLKIVRSPPPAEFAGNTPWIVIAFGTANVLVVTPHLAQVTGPATLSDYLGIELESVRVFGLKSRVHFRRGFVDGGLVSEVVVVEPDQPFLGTTRLDALSYVNLQLENYYPYGRNEFQQRLIAGRSRATR